MGNDATKKPSQEQFGAGVLHLDIDVNLITPIGLDTSNNFVYKPDDQAAIDAIRARGGCFDERKGIVTLKSCGGNNIENPKEIFKAEQELNYLARFRTLCCGMVGLMAGTFFLIVLAILVLVVVLVQQPSTTDLRSPVSSPSVYPSVSPSLSPSVSPSLSPSLNLPPSTSPTLGFIEKDIELSACDVDFHFDMEPKDEDVPFPRKIRGSADDDGGNCSLRLTDDRTIGISSTAMTMFRFSPENMEKRFSLTFGYRLFGSNGLDGDGMAFVMHHGADTFRIGRGGGYFGIYGAVINALVVELDSHYNSGNFDLLDFSAPNVHVITVDSAGRLTEVDEVRPPSGIRTDENGESSGRLWIEYCGEPNSLQVFLNPLGDNKPTIPLITAPLNLTAVLGGGNVDEVFIGFGAATGSSVDNHEVTTLKITETCSI